MGELACNTLRRTLAKQQPQIFSETRWQIGSLVATNTAYRVELGPESNPG